ncbi:DUF6183 family protein [Actinoplanes sp. NPDC049316]|uniref:DUF6183 family protein n=1 Tax=Actinoplanes sp. NPDC049316 TaxID=3154727 RepID=UPI003423C836
MEDPEEVAAGLTDLDNVTDVWAAADRRLAAGDAAYVADLGIAVWQRYGRDPAPPWQSTSVFDHILRLLTLTPGVIEQALRLISITLDRRRCRYAASLLASAHPPRALDAVFSGVAAEELRACLLQEIVLRGGSVDHPWTESSHWRHHPLAWLPRSLTPMEGRPDLPAYSRTGGSGPVPSLTAPPARNRGPVPAARETTTDTEAAAISSAVANWTERSNGRIEARTFALDGDLDPGAVGGLLRSLRLASFEDPKTEPGPCTVTQVWQLLFTAASCGGAYGDAQHGAYGRLLAWRSVAALAGAPHGASAVEVEALAQQCSWHSYALATDWFEDVTWDVGLAAGSPDRRRLTVLAATDTD